MKTPLRSSRLEPGAKHREAAKLKKWEVFGISTMSMSMIIFHSHVTNYQRVYGDVKGFRYAFCWLDDMVMYICIYLVGGLEHFLFSYILGIILQTDYFSEGLKPPTRLL